jgi:hypothetical protein
LAAKSICTFGIREVHRERLDPKVCRAALNLPDATPLLLYTGRLMEDKGIRELIQVVALVRQERPEARLVLATTHLTPWYFNELAGGLAGAILFYSAWFNSITPRTSSSVAPPASLKRTGNRPWKPSPRGCPPWCPSGTAFLTI